MKAADRGEICGTLPAAWAYGFFAQGDRERWLTRLTGGGRQIATSSISRFFTALLARLIAAGGAERPFGYRAGNKLESAGGLELIGNAAQQNYALAVEIADCQQLVKGYGEDA